MKTSELKGVALDWAVARCEGLSHRLHGHIPYSSDWAQGGPIIEREKIELAYRVGVNWTATRIEGPAVCEVTVPYNQKGSPQLIAAMRCYVASKLGDDVEIPNELTTGESK